MPRKKIDKKKATEIIKRFIETELVKEECYQKIKPHIKAIVLYGSVAKGMNYSDIDFLIFVPIIT